MITLKDIENMSNTLQRKCLLCRELVNSLSPVCDRCKEKNKINEIANISMLNQFFKINKYNDTKKIAEFTGLPVYAVLWYTKGSKRVYEEKRVIDNGEKSGISISASKYEEIIWIDLGGNIDSQNSGELQKYIASLIDDGWKDIVLDMSAVKYLSSSGIRVILSTYKALVNKGSFYVANPSSNVENVLGMVALDSLLLKLT